MKVYLAGPMRGKPYYNFPAFDEAAKRFESEGHEVWNPAQLDRDNGFDAMILPDNYNWNEIPEGFDFRACVRRDIDAILECDAVYLLNGWSKSKGAIAEWAIARWLDLDILTQADEEEINASRNTTD